MRSLLIGTSKKTQNLETESSSLFLSYVTTTRISCKNVSHYCSQIILNKHSDLLDKKIPFLQSLFRVEKAQKLNYDLPTLSAMANVDSD